MTRFGLPDLARQPLGCMKRGCVNWIVATGIARAPGSDRFFQILIIR